LFSLTAQFVGLSESLSHSR